MPYVKLDTDTLNSSLWVSDYRTRITFLTMLMLANPEGFVHAKTPGIARAAVLPIEDVRKALEELESPDPDSRSENHDGRRIERVEGGYQIINYLKYREKEHSSAARMRAKRERDREGWGPLIDKQDRKCGCCDSPFETPYSRYVVQDHHHETGQMRALLCQSCNKLVGQYENGATMLNEAERGMCARYVTKWAELRHCDVTGVTVTQAEAEAEAEVSTPTGVEAESSRIPPCPQREIVALWNETMPDQIPRVLSWKGARESNLRARWREYPQIRSIEWWRDFFGWLQESRFLMGKTNGSGDRPPFLVTLAWLVKPENFQKAIEGTYHRG